MWSFETQNFCKYFTISKISQQYLQPLLPEQVPHTAKSMKPAGLLPDIVLILFLNRHLQLSAQSQGSCNGYYRSWHLNQNFQKEKSCHIHQQINLVHRSGRTYLNLKKKEHSRKLPGEIMYIQLLCLFRAPLVPILGVMD